MSTQSMDRRPDKLASASNGSAAFIEALEAARGPGWAARRHRRVTIRQAALRLTRATSSERAALLAARVRRPVRTPLQAASARACRTRSAGPTCSGTIFLVAAPKFPEVDQQFERPSSRSRCCRYASNLWWCVAPGRRERLAWRTGQGGS